MQIRIAIGGIIVVKFPLPLIYTPEYILALRKFRKVRLNRKHYLPRPQLSNLWRQNFWNHPVCATVILSMYVMSAEMKVCRANLEIPKLIPCTWVASRFGGSVQYFLAIEWDKFCSVTLYISIREGKMP